MNAVTIWGFMGAGKSTVGRILQDQYRWVWLDTDQEIERQEGRSIAQIFAQEGEAYFRTVETQLLAELHQQLKSPSRSGMMTVITTGGGMPINPESRRWLKKIGPSIYLYVPFPIIARRLKRDQSRPLWDEKQLSHMEEKFNWRQQYYRQADYIIDAKERSAFEIAAEVVQMVGQNNKV